MTPEVLERVKRPYYTTREGGTGLGIAVARALVEQHGGRLAFASTPGRGTTVTIELPRSPPPGDMLLDTLRGRPEAH
jgi:signal transduction histidine kinase